MLLSLTLYFNSAADIPTPSQKASLLISHAVSHTGPVEESEPNQSGQRDHLRGPKHLLGEDQAFT